MLPVLDGFSVARKLRSAHNQTPILMLTARDANRDVVEGLNLGADDYLVKPFSLRFCWPACRQSPVGDPFRNPSRCRWPI